MSDLPPGWIVAIDPSSGQSYYANPVTGESSWKFPGPNSSIDTEGAPPPPNTMGGRFVPPNRPGDGPPNTSADQSFVPATGLPEQPSEANNERSGTDQGSKVDSIVTLASNGLLVAATRILADAQSQDQENAKTLELYSLTAGQIADLHKMQQEELHGKQDGTIVPYVPINAYKLPEGAKASPLESARLDTRVHALYDKLKKIPQE